MSGCPWPKCSAPGREPLGFCDTHWFYVPYELREFFWRALGSSDPNTTIEEQHIAEWVARYTGMHLTSKICDVISKPQSAVLLSTKGDLMSNTPVTAKLLAAALVAAANVLTSPEAGATAAVATPPKDTPKRGRPAKPAAPAADDLGDGDDLGDDGLGDDGLGDDGLGDDGLGDAPAAPTEDDLRAALIKLKNLDGDNTRVQAVCKKFVKPGAAPLAKNVPPEQYAAAIELIEKTIARGKKK